MCIKILNKFRARKLQPLEYGLSVGALQIPVMMVDKVLHTMLAEFGIVVHRSPQNRKTFGDYGIPCGSTSVPRPIQ